MNLEQVASYLAVIRTGSFHAAARERGLSQASVSQHVRALEEQQRTALVIRDCAGCRPVAGTEEFAHYAALLVDLAGRTARVLSSPRVMVGAASNIGTYLVQPTFRRFVDEHDDLDAELLIGPNGEIADRLEAGGLDVALMEWWDDRPGFRSLDWAEEELLVIVGPEHPWRDRSTVRPAELADQPILGGEPQTGTGTLLRRQLGPLSQALRVTMNLGSTEAVKRAVRHGLGISLVLAGAVQDELATGRLHALELEPPLHKPLWAIVRQDLPSSSRTWSFIGPDGSILLEWLVRPETSQAPRLDGIADLAPWSCVVNDVAMRFAPVRHHADTVPSRWHVVFSPADGATSRVAHFVWGLLQTVEDVPPPRQAER